MNTRLPNYAALENAIVKEQLTAGLRHALDRNFQRLIAAAKAEWERHYAGDDPSDSCVSVRIHEPKESSVRCAGLLQKRENSPNGKTRPRLA